MSTVVEAGALALPPRPAPPLRRQDPYLQAALAWAQEFGFDGGELPKGCRKDADNCPLALATGFVVEPNEAFCAGRLRVYPLPPLVRDFVRRYDRGGYRHLDLEAGDA